MCQMEVASNFISSFYVRQNLDERPFLRYNHLGIGIESEKDGQGIWLSTRGTISGSRSLRGKGMATRRRSLSPSGGRSGASVGASHPLVTVLGTSQCLCTTQTDAWLAWPSTSALQIAGRRTWIGRENSTWISFPGAPRGRLWLKRKGRLSQGNLRCTLHLLHPLFCTIRLITALTLSLVCIW